MNFRPIHQTHFEEMFEIMHFFERKIQYWCRIFNFNRFSSFQLPITLRRFVFCFQLKRKKSEEVMIRWYISISLRNVTAFNAHCKGLLISY